MSLKSSTTIPLLAFGLAAGLAACSPQVMQHGYTVDEAAVQRIVPGVTPREEVARLLGSPSTLATFEDSRWYYVTQRLEQLSFYQSEITEQSVLTIAFDDRGIVQDVSHVSMDEAMEIDPDSDVTPSLGNEMTIFEQLIGNVGRFGDPVAGQLGGRPAH